ncbi:MAG: hypothetical protein CBC42_05320 [Betaproteobacteria bacterium TMED82]|nr:MAG: hypothetical protein CBC42_05320 [Betaproteobacteria bacterium TMED82]|tara:strand:- start:11169 stop:12362 length:1194 start_codon:yes stop_codon:yes gene_type:complete
MTTCTICGHSEFETYLSLGKQGASNLYLSERSRISENKFNLSLGVCKNCGTIQLIDRLPIDSFRPVDSWLKYNEPEGHLDDLVASLLRLGVIEKSSIVSGLTYKDESTMSRLKKSGVLGSAVIDYEEIFGESFFGMETFQEKYSSTMVVKKIAEVVGLSDVIFARHIVEHAPSASTFLTSVSKLIKPYGFLVLEFPDSTKIFEKKMYPFVWEEHFSYLSEKSGRHLSNCLGGKVYRTYRYKYRYEDSLVVVIRKGALNNKSKNTINWLYETQFDEKVLNSFKLGFDDKKNAWNQKLVSLKKNHQRIGIFGGGHLSAKFINFFNLEKFFFCAIDGNEFKVGCFLPGTTIPIISPKQCLEKGISLCITTLSPESEKAVKKNFSEYFNRGGIFLSAFEDA